MPHVENTARGAVATRYFQTDRSKDIKSTVVYKTGNPGELMFEDLDLKEYRMKRIYHMPWNEVMLTHTQNVRATVSYMYV